MYIPRYLFVVIVAVLISTGSCIRCYNCYSGRDSGCAQLTDPAILPTECNADLIRNMSAKMTEEAKLFGAFRVDIDPNRVSQFPQGFVCQKVVTLADGQELVTRTCQVASTEELNMCTMLEKSQSSKTKHCSFCDENGCNAAVWLSPISTILYVPAMALAIWALLF